MSHAAGYNDRKNSMHSNTSNYRARLVAALALAACWAPSIFAADQIVVYRSQFERDRDQWLYENPEVILWGFGLLAAVLLVWIAVNIIWSMVRRRL